MVRKITHNVAKVLRSVRFARFASQQLKQHEEVEAPGTDLPTYRCGCRTLLYLPCIFRLRTETIWVSATLRILIEVYNIIHVYSKSFR